MVECSTICEGRKVENINVDIGNRKIFSEKLELDKLVISPENGLLKALAFF